MLSVQLNRAKLNNSTDLFVGVWSCSRWPGQCGTDVLTAVWCTVAVPPPSPIESHWLLVKEIRQYSPGVLAFVYVSRFILSFNKTVFFEWYSNLIETNVLRQTCCYERTQVGGRNGLNARWMNARERCCQPGNYCVSMKGCFSVSNGILIQQH